MLVVFAVIAGLELAVTGRRLEAIAACYTVRMNDRRLMMRFLVALLGLILLAPAGPAHAADDAANESAQPIPTAWLEERISVQDVEAGYSVIAADRLDQAPAAIFEPLGSKRSEWDALKAEMKPGDEVWTFASPADSWVHLAGRAGYALVRAGKPIKVIVTIMN
jgi:hypothetical protein